MHSTRTFDAKSLVVLGCSASKAKIPGFLPAIHLYDGPAFRVLRTYLRQYQWPQSLSVAVLSAKHGLIGGLCPLARYELQMTADRAVEIRSAVTNSLQRLVPQHLRVELFLGRGYLASINFSVFDRMEGRFHLAEGGIGEKLSQLRQTLHSFPRQSKMSRPELPRVSRPLYFLPDWDDFLDADFDFEKDRFSSPLRSDRNQAHGIALMRPRQLCDGVLVSLAQNLGSKGMLRRVTTAEQDTIAPRSVRQHFSLHPNQWAFGDCGAFSYISERKPSISVRQAVAAYDLHTFDLGASVDHIPAKFAVRNDKQVRLSKAERLSRVELTRQNAQDFISEHRRTDARFIPVGIIQGIEPAAYGAQVSDYVDMGYSHLALGGLVPRNDIEITAIVTAVSQVLKKLGRSPWLHLLGIFRPQLQARFRALGVNSFDSATYFRKAWLRADQNYLACDGTWYAALRIPMSTDPRTFSKLSASGMSRKEIRHLERRALTAIRKYDEGLISVDACLRNVLRYDDLLTRRSDSKLEERYRQTLESKPWQRCTCPVCRSVGIHVLVFRGLNRNKRRGAHNTLQLYESLAILN
jgi:hypothetical protein